MFSLFYFATWYVEAGSDIKLQGESKHVVDTVYVRKLKQLQRRALAFLLAFINNSVIAAQHHGGPPPLVGLR